MAGGTKTLESKKPAKESENAMLSITDSSRALQTSCNVQSLQCKKGIAASTEQHKINNSTLQLKSLPNNTTTGTIKQGDGKPVHKPSGPASAIQNPRQTEASSTTQIRCVASHYSTSTTKQPVAADKATILVVGDLTNECFTQQMVTCGAQQAKTGHSSQNNARGAKQAVPLSGQRAVSSCVNKEVAGDGKQTMMSACSKLAGPQVGCAASDWVTQPAAGSTQQYAKQAISDGPTLTSSSTKPAQHQLQAANIQSGADCSSWQIVQVKTRRRPRRRTNNNLNSACSTTKHTS
jgi:hypothetical protein